MESYEITVGTLLYPLPLSVCEFRPFCCDPSILIAIQHFPQRVCLFSGQGHSGSFQLGTFVIIAAISINDQICVFLFSKHLCGEWLSPRLCLYMFSWYGYPQAIFQRVCTTLHFYQQQFLLFQYLSLPVLFILAIQVGGAGAALSLFWFQYQLLASLFFDWGLNFLSFLLVAEILLFQFLLKVIHPTGNLLTSFLSLPHLCIVISPWPLLSATFARTSQPHLWATPAGAPVTFVGVLCESPSPVDSQGPWFKFSALPRLTSPIPILGLILILFLHWARP